MLSATSSTDGTVLSPSAFQTWATGVQGKEKSRERAALKSGPVFECVANAVLAVADKADSQDVCFIPKDAGRNGFLSDRMPVTGGRLVTVDLDATLVTAFSEAVRGSHAARPPGRP